VDRSPPRAGRFAFWARIEPRLLHAMTTQDVKSLTPGHGGYAFFLNAQGRILGDVNIFAARSLSCSILTGNPAEVVRSH